MGAQSQCTQATAGRQRITIVIRSNTISVLIRNIISFDSVDVRFHNAIIREEAKKRLDFLTDINEQNEKRWKRHLRIVYSLVVLSLEEAELLLYPIAGLDDGKLDWLARLVWALKLEAKPGSN